jgi:hypothetical protein
MRMLAKAIVPRGSDDGMPQKAIDAGARNLGAQGLNFGRVHLRARIDDRDHANAGAQQAPGGGVEAIMVPKERNLLTHVHSVTRQITLPRPQQQDAGAIVIREGNRTLGRPHGHDEGLGSDPIHSI